MKVRVKVYDSCKYDMGSEVVNESAYDITSYEIATRTDEEVYNEGYDITDDFNEYLILKFADGSTATFRNSYVDMFRE